MTHPAQLVCGLFDEETQPYLGPTGGQLISQENYAVKQKGDAFGSYQWLIAGAANPNDLTGIANTRPDIYGAELETFMRKATSHFGQMNFVGEDIALPENRVTPSNNKDKNAVLMAAATHNIGEQTDHWRPWRLKKAWRFLKRQVQANPGVAQPLGCT